MRIGWRSAGRRVEQREIADAGEAHLQRARDGRGREGEHVDVGLELLDAFLVTHTEPLLLVDDEQAEVLEADVFGQQAMRADHEVDAAVGETLAPPSRPASA